MNISYFRDTRHNYLVMKVDEGFSNSYQYKMVENNDIDGLVSFSHRNMDGENFLYYEIDSRQSIENKYLSRKMKKQELTRFLQDYIKVCGILDKFLLDESCILMRPDCIFEEFSSGRFFFLYNPLCDSGSDFFMKDLMRYVDMNDHEASALTYKICDSLMDNSCGSSLVVAEILKAECVSKEPVPEIVTYTKADIDPVENEPDLSDDEEEEVEHKVIRIRIPFRLSFIMSGLFLIVAAALFYLRVAYVLTYEENLLDLGTLMVSVMMALICIIQGFKQKKKLSGQDEEFDDDEDEDNEESADLSYENTSYRNASVKEVEEEDFEETVLLNFDFKEESRHLKGIGEVSHLDFDLSGPPKILGKLRSCADLIISDPTVSRMHARIYESINKGDYILQDLNSKNGTYHNGRRLAPNEEVTLFAGDEVTFGKCTFAYR